MPGPMEGLRVVELGMWVAAPAASGILADWGADVVKIESPDGDPYRWFLALMGADIGINPLFELDNRGKRSIALHLDTDEGAEIARRLADGADVFVTNFRMNALERFGLDYETLSSSNPGLVYSLVTGYGPTGPDRDRASFDFGAFWSRAGIAASITREGGDPPWQRPGMGDHTTGLATLSGILAALRARDRTGKGQLVTTSLLRTGIYFAGADVNLSLRLGGMPLPKIGDRKSLPNPLVGYYRDADGRWFVLLGLQADRHWPDFARAVGRPELVDDDRFATLAARREHSAELVSLFDEIFATAPLAEWGPRFDAEDVWWAPVQEVHEVAADPQVAAAGGIVEVQLHEGPTPAVASPVDFSDTAWAPGGPSPEIGEHTEEVLVELGYDWDDITSLHDNGAIP